MKILEKRVLTHLINYYRKNGLKKLFFRLLLEIKNVVLSRKKMLSKTNCEKTIDLGYDFYWGNSIVFDYYDRKGKLLSRIDINLDGLEIGALSNPLITKEESKNKILYVDYATADDLKKVYKNDTFVNTEKIVKTDLVWGDKKLKELVNDKLINYIVASHVIEHVPDMIGWLKEIADVLDDHGVLSLAIPDKRYTFDFFRELTTPGMLIEAYFYGYRRPSPQAVFDYAAFSGPVNVNLAWRGEIKKSDIEFTNTLHKAFELAKDSFVNQKYQDAHVNIFTPIHFLEIIEILSKLNLFDFVVVDFFDTVFNSLEFFISLERIPRGLDDNVKLDIQLQAIELSKMKLSDRFR